jgi:hypothetical protein
MNIILVALISPNTADKEANTAMSPICFLIS